MHDPWTHLRDVFERAMGNLERKESALARTHLRAAEHTSETIGRKAQGDERHRAGVIFTAVRKAEHLIDMNRALEVLREAHTEVFTTPSSPAAIPADASAAPPPSPPTNL
jgi:hypothetical protein